VAQVVDLAIQLLEQSAAFYAHLAKVEELRRDQYEMYSSQDRKSQKQVKSSYRYLISDALETSFSFNLDASDFSLESLTAEPNKVVDPIGQAKNVEETLIRYFRAISSQSESLMAGIPEIFSSLAGRHMRRLGRLAKTETTPEGHKNRPGFSGRAIT
jgi:hypothetical protein